MDSLQEESSRVETIPVNHILIDTGLGKGVEEYGNMGDVSMLQVAVDRLHKLFPHARIEVLTDSAKNLARYCPAATPLDNRGRALWFANGVLLGRFGSVTPRLLVHLLVRLKGTIRSRYPNFLKAILVRRLKAQNRRGDAETVEAFTRSLEEADLVLISGAGGFYDGCRTWNFEILDLIEAAIQRKTPVVMLGQGLGPLSDSAVIKRAAKILPLVDFITLRGGRESFSILRSLGVAESKVQTTGDEALELAYEARVVQPGRGLGVGLRFGASATVNDDEVERLRPILHDFARRHHVPLIPLPIAIQAYTRDDLAIKRVLSGFDEESDGGKTLDSPLKVIKQVGRCRVVVTGAYHAAVFALGQGIPVISLAKSAYFSGKLLGLEDQFGAGCQTILLNEPGWPEKLRESIEIAWQNADTLRETLQAATRRQIDLSRESYKQIKKLVSVPQHEQNIRDRSLGTAINFSK